MVIVFSAPFQTIKGFLIVCGVLFPAINGVLIVCGVPFQTIKVGSSNSKVCVGRIVKGKISLIQIVSLFNGILLFCPRFFHLVPTI